MSKDDNMIPFYKDHGFTGEWSNVIESTYDLVRVLEYCVSEEMNYTPERLSHDVKIRRPRVFSLICHNSTE